MSKWYLYDDAVSFISEISHELKRYGDEYVIDHILEKISIDTLIEMKKNYEAVFLIALLDYLCVMNNRPKLDQLNKYRNMKMNVPTYTEDVYLYEQVTQDFSRRKRILQTAIPEFMNRNIVINNVRFAC